MSADGFHAGPASHKHTEQKMLAAAVQTFYVYVLFSGRRSKESLRDSAPRCLFALRKMCIDGSIHCCQGSAVHACVCVCVRVCVRTSSMATVLSLPWQLTVWSIFLFSQSPLPFALSRYPVISRFWPEENPGSFSPN